MVTLTQNEVQYVADCINGNNYQNGISIDELTIMVEDSDNGILLVGWRYDPYSEEEYEVEIDCESIEQVKTLLP